MVRRRNPTPHARERRQFLVFESLEGRWLLDAGVGMACLEPTLEKPTILQAHEFRVETPRPSEIHEFSRSSLAAFTDHVQRHGPDHSPFRSYSAIDQFHDDHSGSFVPLGSRSFEDGSKSHRDMTPPKKGESPGKGSNLPKKADPTKASDGTKPTPSRSETPGGAPRIGFVQRFVVLQTDPPSRSSTSPDSQSSNLNPGNRPRSEPVDGILFESPPTGNNASVLPPDVVAISQSRPANGVAVQNWGNNVSSSSSLQLLSAITSGSQSPGAPTGLTWFTQEPSHVDEEAVPGNQPVIGEESSAVVESTQGSANLLTEGLAVSLSALERAVQSMMGRFHVEPQDTSSFAIWIGGICWVGAAAFAFHRARSSKTREPRIGLAQAEDIT